MDLIDRLRDISARIPKQIDHIHTEEATKNAFVLPFISSLGYDVFNPIEVIPEFTADIGVKKGEKVDYAIKKDGQIVMLVECKWCNCNLDQITPDQLARYFNVTDSRFGLLTNGIYYKFYSDIERANIMDPKPFFEFNMLDIDEHRTEEIKKFSKSLFDLGKIVEAASELKYTNEIKNVFAEELSNPSDGFVKFFTGRVYSGKMTKPILEQFSKVVKKALSQFISEKISSRLKSALEEEKSESIPPETGNQVDADPEAVTGKKADPEGFEIRKRFWTQLLESAKAKTTLHAHRSPSKWHYLDSWKQGIAFVYVVRRDEANVEVYIDQGKEQKDKNKRIFDHLHQNREKIESTFGDSLDWQRLDEKRACRVAKTIKIGGYLNEDRWPEIQQAMIDAMVRLEKAFRPHLPEILNQS
jgi:hypothetical protein